MPIPASRPQQVVASRPVVRLALAAASRQHRCGDIASGGLRMRRITAFCMALWLGAWWAAALAQVPESPHLRVLGPRDGVPSTTLNVIDLDRAGFVWVGSTDGLARYDGAGFRIWAGDLRYRDRLGQGRGRCHARWLAARKQGHDGDHAPRAQSHSRPCGPRRCLLAFHSFRPSPTGP